MGGGTNNMGDNQNVLTKSVIPIVDDSIWDHVRGTRVRVSGDQEDYIKTKDRPLKELIEQAVDRDVDATYSDKGLSTIKFMFVRAYNDALGASYPAVDEHRRPLIVPPEFDNWEFREYFFHENITEYVFDERVAAIQLILDDKYTQDQDRNRSTHIINQSNRCYAGLDDVLRLMRLPVEVGGFTYVMPTDDSWSAGFAGKGDPAIHPAPVEDSLTKYRAGLFLGQRTPYEWNDGLFLHQGPSSNDTVDRYDRRQNPPFSRYGKAADIMMVTPEPLFDNFVGVNVDGDTVHYVCIRRSAHVFSKHLIGFTSQPSNGSFHIIPGTPPVKNVGLKISGDLEYAAWAANQYTELEKEDSQIVPVITLPAIYLPWTPVGPPLPGTDFPGYVLPVETNVVGPLTSTPLPHDISYGGVIQAPVTSLDGLIAPDAQALTMYAMGYGPPRYGELLTGGTVVLKVSASIYSENGDMRLPTAQKYGEILLSMGPDSHAISDSVSDVHFDVGQFPKSCNQFACFTYYRDTDDPRDTYPETFYLEKFTRYPTDSVANGRIWHFRAGDVLVDSGYVPAAPPV